MRGVEIVGTLLRDYAPLIAIIPAASIKEDMLPENQFGIVLKSVSLTDRQTLSREPLVRSVERVSATVRAGSVIDRDARLVLVRRCLTLWTGSSLGDAQRISVLSAGAGPSLLGPGNSFERTHDFRVFYDAPR
ncbi:hypothetical protein [Sphingomonas sp. VDB2]|uniref:hypothetical protein n=1 Tax=Sphingomonas sp. VDB2 TaxID=3228751 RepID=UPI003A80090C